MTLEREVLAVWQLPPTFIYTIIRTCAEGVATCIENSNKIVSVTSYLRKTIVTIAFANDFVQGGHVELFRVVALYRCNLIG